MAFNTESREVIPLKDFIFPGTGKNYDSPIDVNIYGWPLDEKNEATAPFIGKGRVLGIIPDDSDDPEEPMPFLEIDDGTGKKIATVGLFFEITPVDVDDGPGPNTPRMSYDEYMSLP